MLNLQIRSQKSQESQSQRVRAGEVMAARPAGTHLNGCDQDSLELDMDSSLLEVHGAQEKASYNGH